jgi:spermidine synthase
MLPATFLAGMTLPLITTVLLRGRFGERSVGYVYAANTVGSIIGVVLAVHLAMPLLGAKGALLLAAAIDIALGVWIMFAQHRSGERVSTVGWAALGCASLLIVAFLAPVSFERTASGVYRDGTSRLAANSTVLFHRDGKAATVAVVKQDDSIAIRTNGKPDAAIDYGEKEPSQDEYTMAILGMLPLAYKPDAKRVAVIGFGSGMTTATLLGSPSLERVDTIEIEPRMVEGARLFGDRVAVAFNDPRSRIVIDDAKSYFARGGDKYDVIVSEPSNPWVSGVSSLFTVEFYRRVKSHLSEGGLLVQWIQTYEITDALVATILRAIDAEFADYAVYDSNDGDILLVASATPLRPVPEEGALRAMVLPSEVWRLQLHTLADLESRRVAGKRIVKALLPSLGDGLNSDFHPIVDHLAPKARFMKNKADALSQLAVAPIPVVEMLEGRPSRLLEAESLGATHPGARRRAIANARLLGTWLQNGGGGRLPEPWAMDVARDGALVRAYLWNCASMIPGTNFVDNLLVFAGEINPYLSARAAGEVWAAAQTAPCYRRLTEEERNWVELVRAVGARSPERMIAVGRELLADDALTISRREYALLATATGLLVAGRHREARDLLDAQLAKLPASRAQLPWTRALRGYAHQERA